MKRIVMMVILAAIFMLIGCGPSINWDSRVGSYTYEQAVDDLGEPRSQEETRDGNMRYYWYDLGDREWSDVYIMIFTRDGVLKEVERIED